ncbi:MAG TPA: PEGA domain-containing protein [Longimicrobium sp.]
MKKNRFAVAALGLALAGCATIMQGGSQYVGVSSSPTGAAVFVDDQPAGVTPTTLNLTRRDHHVVRLELPGYQPYEIQLVRGVSGWVWGNLVFGGLPGLAVDALTGGIYKLTPNTVNATLATGATTLRTGDQLHVQVVLAADPAWQKIGQLTRE